MKKEMILKQFPKELEYLASKIFNAYEMASEYEIISFWKKFQKKMNGLNVITNGIFEDSDRRQIAFVPDSFMTEDVENSEILDFPCKLIKISINSKFKEYQHKDFLGSLMGLNRKREVRGDVFL